MAVPGAPGLLIGMGAHATPGRVDEVTVTTPTCSSDCDEGTGEVQVDAQRGSVQQSATPYCASARSSSSSSALTSTSRQKKSIAAGVWRRLRSHSSMVVPEAPAGRPPLRTISPRARAMPSLSAAPRLRKRTNEGARCSGTGSGEAPKWETRPSRSANSRWSKNRIFSRAPTRP